MFYLQDEHGFPRKWALRQSNDGHFENLAWRASAETKTSS